MRHSSVNSFRHGFTVVEIMVIVAIAAILLPLVMNTLADFYQGNINSAHRATQNTDARTVLRTIQKDLSYSTSFLERQNLTNPLIGPDNSATGSTVWTATIDSDNSRLLAHVYATADVSGQRTPIFYLTGSSDDCTRPTRDMALKNTLIYYTAQDPSYSHIKNLYRRTIVGTTPTGTQCPRTSGPITLTPSQKTTCWPSISTGICTASTAVGKDAVIMRDINTFRVDYYIPSTNPPGSSLVTSAASIPASSSIEVSVTPMKRGTVVPEAVSTRIIPFR